MTDLSMIDYEKAVSHPNFAYGRTGDGLYRGFTLIYHWDTESPSGVKLYCSAPSRFIDELIRKHQNTSPLSPTEGLNKSGVTL